MTSLPSSAATVPRRGLLLATLFAAQVGGSTGHSIVMAVGGITAASITGTNRWIGVPVAVLLGLVWLCVRVVRRRRENALLQI